VKYRLYIYTLFSLNGILHEIYNVFVKDGILHEIYITYINVHMQRRYPAIIALIGPRNNTFCAFCLIT